MSSSLPTPVQAFCATLQLEEGPSPSPSRTLQPPHAEAGPEVASCGPPLSGLAADLEPGELLGAGGMGEVRSAWQRSLGRSVAIKVPHAEASAQQALLREARLTGALEHPRIVPVHGLGLDAEGRPLLVMKRVEGEPWRRLLAEPEHSAWERVGSEADPLGRNLELLLAVCDAVEFAHSKQVLHRDLKPDNVLVGPFGEVYLVDWGLAVSRAAAPPYPAGGTPGYMAPEMLEQAADERTDVFLLGAVLHELLTGQRRHTGASLLAVLAAASRAEPARYGPEVPAELGAIANRACAADPAERYPSVGLFRAALVEFLQRRGARALTAAARGRLAALAEALTQGRALAATRLAVECRFAFRQALDAGDEQAAAGLRECLALQLQHELAERNLTAAEALLSELEALGAPTGRERERLDAARLAAAETERLRDAHDTSVARPQRALVLGLGIALALLLSLTFRGLVQTGALETSAEALVLPAAATLLGLVVASLVGRRYLLRNAFNRRLMGFFFVALSGMFIHRVQALAFGTEFAEVIAVDMVLMATVTGIGAMEFHPALWLLTLIYLATGLVITLVPVVALPAGTLAVGATLVGLGVALWRDLRQLRS